MNFSAETTALRSVKVVRVFILAVVCAALLLSRFGTALGFSPEGRPVLKLFLLASE